MIKRPKNHVKVSTSGSAGSRGRMWQAVSSPVGNIVTRDPHTGRINGSKVAVQIFIGPSVEGGDVEYIERVRGKVSDRKPSFVR